MKNSELTTISIYVHDLRIVLICPPSYVASAACNIFDTDLLSGMIHCEEKKIIKYKSEKKCAYCKNGLIYDNLCF